MRALSYTSWTWLCLTAALMLPPSGAVFAQAVTRREVTVELPGLAGAGERWTLAAGPARNGGHCGQRPGRSGLDVR